MKDSFSSQNGFFSSFIFSRNNEYLCARIANCPAQRAIEKMEEKKKFHSSQLNENSTAMLFRQFYRFDILLENIER